MRSLVVSWALLGVIAGGESGPGWVRLLVVSWVQGGCGCLW